MLLGEMLYELGSFAEAEAVLSEAQALAETEQQALLLVTMRTKNLQFGLCDSQRGTGGEQRSVGEDHRRPSCARSSRPTTPVSACSRAGRARRSTCSTG